MLTTDLRTTQDRSRQFQLFALTCLLSTLALFLPVYADGIDGLIDSLINKITPIFQALCRLSWFLAALCLAIAFIQFMMSGSGGDRNSIMWLKNILIAVVAINIIGGVLTYIQGELSSGDLSNGLQGLGNYSGN